MQLVLSECRTTFLHIPTSGVFGSQVKKKLIDADKALIIYDYSNLWIIVFFVLNLHYYCYSRINDPVS